MFRCHIRIEAFRIVVGSADESLVQNPILVSQRSTPPLQKRVLKSEPLPADKEMQLASLYVVQ
jgi:hypothetical protein